MNLSPLRHCLAAAGLCLLTGLGLTAPASAEPDTRDVLVVSNNWDGTADFIDANNFQRLLRLNIIPDRDERLREIWLNPVRYAQYLAVQQMVGEGHDQFADDGFTSPDGRYLYISRPSFADVVAFDLSTRRIVWRTPVEGYRADHMALSPDGQRLTVSASTAGKAHVIDVSTGKIVGSFDSGDQPHESNYARDGRRIFHASIGTVYSPLDEPWMDGLKGERLFQVVDAQTMAVLKRVNISKKLAEAGHPGMSPAVRPMAIAPDERYFYFQLSFFHGLVEYDLQEDRVRRVLNLPNWIPNKPRSAYLLDSAHHGLAITPDGSKLCVAGTMDNYIAIVNRASFARKVMPSGERPYWATTSADGRYCFVSLAGADQIAVIDYATEQHVASIPVGYHPQRSRMGHLAAALVSN